MRKRTIAPLVTLLLAASCLSPLARAGAQGGGVSELPGVNGKLGQILTVGQDQPYKVNFALTGAYYTLGRLVFANRNIAPNKDQKLMVLKFTVQNSNKTDWLLRGDTFRFTAVDTGDNNFVSPGVLAKSEVNKEQYSARLKPAQKVEVVTGVLVPTDAVIPKLIVSYATSKRVIRYAINTMVKPLTPPFADPQDSTGVKAPTIITAENGVFYPMNLFDVKFDGVSGASLTTPSLEKNKTWQAVTLTVRNAQFNPWLLRYDTFAITVASNDGDKSRRVYRLCKMNSEDDASRQLDPGEELSVRFVLMVPAKAQSTTVTIYEGQSHSYVFKVQ